MEHDRPELNTDSEGEEDEQEEEHDDAEPGGRPQGGRLALHEFLRLIAGRMPNVRRLHRAPDARFLRTGGRVGGGHSCSPLPSKAASARPVTAIHTRQMLQGMPALGSKPSSGLRAPLLPFPALVQIWASPVLSIMTPFCRSEPWPTATRSWSTTSSQGAWSPGEWVSFRVVAALQTALHAIRMQMLWMQMGPQGMQTRQSAVNRVWVGEQPNHPSSAAPFGPDKGVSWLHGNSMCAPAHLTCAVPV